jgi:hypothetical protein
MSEKEMGIQRGMEGKKLDAYTIPEVYTATVACINVDGKCIGIMLTPVRLNILQRVFEKA